MLTDIPEMLDLMEWSFRAFEAGMATQPQPTKFSWGMTYRYKEKNIYEAMIQKLARAQSLVRAALLLSHNGFIQEQAALHRAIDETNEDIMFLVMAVTNDGSITELHQRYLDAFWEEEVDESGTMLDSAQKRPLIPRDKIRAFLANLDPDPSTAKKASTTISKAFSGFVHGASPHIMDMYYGNPPRFFTQGMLGTERAEEHSRDIWNPVYRSLLSHSAVAAALGAREQFAILKEQLKRFEKNAGKDYFP